MFGLIGCRCYEDERGELMGEPMGDFGKPPNEG
jgi:hypothetical protein